MDLLIMKSFWRQKTLFDNGIFPTALFSLESSLSYQKLDYVQWTWTLAHLTNDDDYDISIDF